MYRTLTFCRFRSALRKSVKHFATRSRPAISSFVLASSSRWRSSTSFPLTTACGNRYDEHATISKFAANNPSSKYHREWIETSHQWLLSLGIDADLLAFKVHAKDKLAHYARACTDITFRFPFGEQELMGVAARGDFDLQQHGRASGKSLEYHDPSDNSKFLPHVIEPSIGVDRLFLALLTSAYREEIVDNEKRVVLALHPAVAPIKVCILPLVGNKPEIVRRAKEVFSSLQMRHMVEFDAAGAIGRRYRRADEAGTPFCVTIDFQSLEDGSLTLRWRDSMKQDRLSLSELTEVIRKEIDGF